ncbi:MAG: hypothetical protein KF833_13120 [Verrucomicrobiae bacterium]|nr:hypothetical protein [Verrucomicrobiae bacterium]
MKSNPNPRRSSRTRTRVLAVLERVGLLGVVGGALWLSWWSVGRVSRVQQESAALTQTASRLSTEIELMQAGQGPGRLEEIARRLADAQDGLFGGGQAVAEWHDGLRSDAVPLALEPAIAFVGTRTNSVGGQSLAVLQATVEVEPAYGIEAARPVYRRVVDFVQNLTSATQRVDLVELRVRGGSNSVAMASVTVDLWAGTFEEDDAP